MRELIMCVLMGIASLLFWRDYSGGSEADLYPAIMYGLFSIVFLFQGYKSLTSEEVQVKTE